MDRDEGAVRGRRPACERAFPVRRRLAVVAEHRSADMPLSAVREALRGSGLIALSDVGPRS
ncbi:hypothetical protein DEO23_11250 [Brachybacterium endophyticum]|uniref:Uncharacterized protein n=1 Tax=Brachybacterium endophyticum TaxID=2182385 RepID=A0A2U2RIR7_9MICO|nr:hypothetical protein DEO23_11250 [Brachybacterium endophyticum]